MHPAPPLDDERRRIVALGVMRLGARIPAHDAWPAHQYPFGDGTGYQPMRAGGAGVRRLPATFRSCVTGRAVPQLRPLRRHVIAERAAALPAGGARHSRPPCPSASTTKQLARATLNPAPAASLAARRRCASIRMSLSYGLSTIPRSDTTPRALPGCAGFLFSASEGVPTSAGYRPMSAWLKVGTIVAVAGDGPGLSRRRSRVRAPSLAPPFFITFLKTRWPTQFA